MKVFNAALLSLSLTGPVAVADAKLRVFVHFPAGAAGLEDDAMRLGLLLQDNGYEIVDLRPVDIEMQAPTIRYFAPELRDDAERLRRRLDPLLAEQRIASSAVRLQDFTFYNPKPPGNAVEIWLPRR